MQSYGQRETHHQPAARAASFAGATGKTIRVYPCMIELGGIGCPLGLAWRAREIRAADSIGCGHCKVHQCLPLVVTKPVVLKFYRLTSVASLVAVIYDRGSSQPASEPAGQPVGMMEDLAFLLVQLMPVPQYVLSVLGVIIVRDVRTIALLQRTIDELAGIPPRVWRTSDICLSIRTRGPCSRAGQQEFIAYTVAILLHVVTLPDWTKVRVDGPDRQGARPSSVGGRLEVAVAGVAASHNAHISALPPESLYRGLPASGSLELR